MARDEPQLKLRLPDELKTRVTEAAQENKRSVNGELVERIEFSFRAQMELDYANERRLMLANELAERTKESFKLQREQTQQTITAIVEALDRMTTVVPTILERLTEIERQLNLLQAKE